MKKNITIVLVLTILSSFIFSQEALKGSEEQYFDFLSLEGIIKRPTLSYRTLSDSVWIIPEGTEHLWDENNLGSIKNLWKNSNATSNFFTDGFFQGINYKILTPQWYNSFNSQAPYGQNDGALWQGRGYNTLVTGGIQFKGYGLEATFKPQIWFAQNLVFEYPKSRYSEATYQGKASDYGDYSLGSIDSPQRFGNKPIFKFDLGDTEIRYTWYNFTVGFGTENIWLGPAQENPIMHSNTAAGYPHLDFGLRRQKIKIKDIDFGDFEIRYWIGKTTESEYFDNDETNNNNLITGISIGYEIPFLEGLTLGVNRTMLSKWNNKSPYTFLALLIPVMKSKSGYDQSDQRASLFADWCIPSGGIDIFFEWGKNDYNSGLDNLIRYPFHTQAITAGFKKNVRYKQAPLTGQFLFEITFIESSMDYHFFYDWGGSGNDFYTHHIITQGYTNQGQYLGAGIGAGGNSQLASYELYYPKGSSKIFIQRVNPDLNYSYFMAPRDSTSKHPNDDVKSAIRVFFNIGIESQYFITKCFLISGSFIFSDEHNPLNKNDNIKTQTSGIASEHRYNFVTQLELKYFF